MEIVIKKCHDCDKKLKFKPELIRYNKQTDWKNVICKECFEKRRKAFSVSHEKNKSEMAKFLKSADILVK